MYTDIVVLFVLLTLGGLGELLVIYKLGGPIAERFGDRVGFHIGNTLTLLSFTPFLIYFFKALTAWGSDPVEFPAWCAPLGWALIAVGSLITWVGIRHLSSARWFSQPKFKQKPDEQLVDHGIYGFIRHPTYLGQSLAIYGVALLIPLKITLLMALFLHLYFSFIHARIEEWRCIQIFGDAYRDYMRRTNRFIPWHALGRLMARKPA